MISRKEWLTPTLSYFAGRIVCESGKKMAVSSKIAERARVLVAPIALRMGYDLIDVEYVKENSDMYLRAYIDRRGGIGVDDCERLSKEFSKELDREDFIASAYILEVSSPGLGRPLTTEADFVRYEGELLELKMLHGADMVVGTLERLEDGRIYLTDESGGQLSVARADVKTAKRAIRF